MGIQFISYVNQGDRQPCQVLNPSGVKLQYHIKSYQTSRIVEE